MMLRRRLSRAHWIVQTQTPSGGWSPKFHAPDVRTAIVAAEVYVDAHNIAARVVLGDTVYYFVDPSEVQP